MYYLSTAYPDKKQAYIASQGQYTHTYMTIDYFMCTVQHGAYKLQTQYMYIHFSLVCVAGPTEETVVKFWQMVWEYQLSTIVMLI